MLANGTKLGYSTDGTSPISYTDLEGLKSIPDMGLVKERVENSSLASTIREYELGIGDPGELEFVFRYKNTAATDSYPVLRAIAAAGTKVFFEETDKDGTKYNFAGTISVVRNGGGVNDPIEFTMTVAIQGDITVTDPTYSV